jgi:hypothetical protein
MLLVSRYYDDGIKEIRKDASKMYVVRNEFRLTLWKAK